MVSQLNFRILKIQEGGREKWKKCDISETPRPFSMTLVLLMHIGLPNTTGQKHSNYKIAKWQMALIFKNRRCAIYPQSIAIIWHDDASRPSGPHQSI